MPISAKISEDELQEWFSRKKAKNKKCNKPKPSTSKNCKSRSSGIKLKKRRQLVVVNEFSDESDEVGSSIICRELTDKKTIAADDAECLFCARRFSEDSNDTAWIHV